MWFSVLPSVSVLQTDRAFDGCWRTVQQSSYKARLMLLHIAYKAERGMDLRNENGIAKVFLANMVHQVVDTAIQLHGALGYSHDTPLARWYTGIRSQKIADGPDEVHRWRTGAT